MSRQILHDLSSKTCLFDREKGVVTGLLWSTRHYLHLIDHGMTQQGAIKLLMDRNSDSIV